MYTHTTYERIRYAHTDKMGYLYYGNYATFYEIGRVEALRSLGISYKEMELEGCLMVVNNLECKYMKPGFYDELIKIETQIRKMPRMGLLSFHHRLFNEKNELINKGLVNIFCVNLITRKKMNTPPYLTNVLKQYFD